jgi:hypothetical protein
MSRQRPVPFFPITGRLLLVLSLAVANVAWSTGPVPPVEPMSVADCDHAVMKHTTDQNTHDGDNAAKHGDNHRCCADGARDSEAHCGAENCADACAALCGAAAGSGLTGQNYAGNIPPQSAAHLTGPDTETAPPLLPAALRPPISA